MATVLITGGTGFIGSALCRHYLARSWQVFVLTRDAAHAQRRLGSAVRVVVDLQDIPADCAPEVIFNLAGQNLASGRWTPVLKQRFVESRVGVTHRVVEYINTLTEASPVLISGSAVGYYGARGKARLDEGASAGEEYQSHLCQAWEKAARMAEAGGTRVCLMRSGVVLGPNGGPLAGLLPMFRHGLGGYLGNGRQWLSWIHIDDWIALAEHLIDHPLLHGPFNATSPCPQTNRDFAKTLGRVLHRPARLRIPGWLIWLSQGQMAHLFLTG
ncbi:MAG TPA: TIGR01777 family oxidoreductase, partial [Nitrococcus sp.]|nr:TIGR01777 family oxidoreductase [Nitrococcus sp.]